MRGSIRYRLRASSLRCCFDGFVVEVCVDHYRRSFVMAAKSPMIGRAFFPAVAGFQVSGHGRERTAACITPTPDSASG